MKHLRRTPGKGTHFGFEYQVSFAIANNAKQYYGRAPFNLGTKLMISVGRIRWVCHEKACMEISSFTTRGGKAWLPILSGSQSNHLSLVHGSKIQDEDGHDLLKKCSQDKLVREWGKPAREGKETKQGYFSSEMLQGVTSVWSHWRPKDCRLHVRACPN